MEPLLMQSPGIQCGGGAGCHRFDVLAKEWEQAATWRRGLRKLGIGLVGVALVCGSGISAWADWNPPESSVTPPAVVTLDAFAGPDLNGAGPSAALVVGPDGALYGSTGGGGVTGNGTLFRLETNGTFTKLYDVSAALIVGLDSALYGFTSVGGANGKGMLFRLETNGTLSKLYDFNGTNDNGPPAALVAGPDGAFYGSTPNGGTSDNGTLFRVETNGTFSKLHDFNYADGALPSPALTVGPDGALYGWTLRGGNGSYGTLFRLQLNGTLTKLHDFGVTDSALALPSAALVVGPDDALYGATRFGSRFDPSNYGTLFRLETNGTFTKLHDFNGADGNGPITPLVVGPNGALYGSSPDGGGNRYPNVNGYGTLFRLATNGAFTELVDFNANSSFPSEPLVMGRDGALYGSTAAGGTGGKGTLFRLSTNGFAKLHDFNGVDGNDPDAPLVVGPDGALYGSTVVGGTASYMGFGTLFRMETNGSFTTLHDFTYTTDDGNDPSAALVVGPDGALYGSTSGGGADAVGTLFRVDASGNFTKLHDLNGADGNGPITPLVVGPDGALYGSNPSGGANGKGTLFRLETNGMFAKLHDFTYTNSVYPSAALVVGSDGALYGSTLYGGTNNGYNALGNGTLFRLQTNGTFTKLHEFKGTDGYGPGPLVVGPDGALYGSTSLGGGGYGTLFRLQTNGNFTKLHEFKGTDGSEPWPLVVGPDGALYGSTLYGGTNNYGTLFRLETSGTFTKLVDFNGTNGNHPLAALVVGPDGALYGATLFGGRFNPGNYGTLFRLETNGTFTKLHDFNAYDGRYPSTPLVVGLDGTLYGSAASAGASGNGTLFRVKPDGTFTKLYDFNGTNGANPSPALVVGPDGALYGSTPNGGPRRGGILFKLVLNRPPVARCHDVTVSAVASCTSDASVDNGSFDPDTGDTLTLRQEPPAPYPLGTTPVTLTVTDNHGASNNCVATVTVMDTTPPTISDVVVSPNILWPPTGKMVEVTFNYTAADDCGGVTNVLTVTSNEAPNGSAPDWVFEGDHHVKLRAERSGTGSGRVYKVTVISTDNAGNSATRTVTVTVPKNQGK